MYPCAWLAGIAWIGTLPLLGRPGPWDRRGDGAGEPVAAPLGPAAARAQLEGAVLPGAHLTGANLRGAALGGACLNAAHLVGAHLAHADLAGADLAAARLVGADLRQANLASACLTGANLDGAELVGAVYDENTEWPAGFNPAQHGAQRVNGLAEVR
jgi:uncharacterized protein YjbI with pentapeptide repeats